MGNGGGGAPISLCAVRVHDDNQSLMSLFELRSSALRLYLAGTATEGDEPVLSSAIARWYLSYDTDGPPRLVVQDASGLEYTLLAVEATASAAYAELWRPLATAAGLVAALRAAAQEADSGADPWQVAAPEMSVEEQLELWPFVREQLRALGIRQIRRPGAAAEDARAEGATEPILPRQTRQLHQNGKRRADDWAVGERRRPRSGGGANSEMAGGGDVEWSCEAGEPLLSELQAGECLEVQQFRCLAPRYTVLSRCRSCCQNRNEQCRFRYMRRLATRDGVVTRSLGTFEQGTGYRLNVRTDVRDDANVVGEADDADDGLSSAASHARYVISHLAGVFEEVVADELALTRGEPVVVVNAKARGTPPKSLKTGYVPEGYSKDGGERQLCDWCSTTLFNRYRTCRRCGFEVCLHCADGWKRSGRRPAAVLKMCAHAAEDWLVFSKVSTQMISALCQSARHLALRPHADEHGGEQREARAPADSEVPAAAVGKGPTPRRRPRSVHEVRRGDGSAEWLRCWRVGEPMVVSDVASRLKQQWTPSHFSNEFGSVEVQLVDLRSTLEFSSPLRAFFAGFADASLRPQPPRALVHGAAGAGAAAPSGPPLLKLKDWPTTRDFAEILPRHFDDLMDAWPQQQYTRRHGGLNLASRLPTYMLPPDLGPKMYVAYGTLSGRAEEVCLFGTTCLHMDMADAVNLMVFVQPDPAPDSAPADASGAAREADGRDALSRDELAWLASEPSDAGAIWDIWASDDEAKLTAFLWRVACEESGEEKARAVVGHPIHDANIYLNAAMRRRLWLEEGVVGYRFVQREGEAVFIPAGCPHQVFNIRSSVKVAEDFVSPENVRLCLRLTEQFRQLPPTHRRKPDNLGIKDILLHSMSHALAVLGASDAVADGDGDDGEAIDGFESGFSD